MTTNTPAPLPPTRDDPRQVSNTLRKRVRYNDPGIAGGLAFANSIPKGAFIMRVLVEIITTFDGTPVLTVGTNASNYDNLANAADVNEGATGINDPTRGLGRSIPANGPVTPFVKLAATAPSQGEAEILIEFAGSAPT